MSFSPGEQNLGENKCSGTILEMPNPNPKCPKIQGMKACIKKEFNIIKECNKKCPFTCQRTENKFICVPTGQKSEN